MHEDARMAKNILVHHVPQYVVMATQPYMTTIIIVDMI